MRPLPAPAWPGRGTTPSRGVWAERLGATLGKLHWCTAENLRPVYPHFDDFLAARTRLDPDRVYANGYTCAVLGG